MGLSRNKVAVSEGAAGSPPFYGESGRILRESSVFRVEQITIDEKFCAYKRSNLAVQFLGIIPQNPIGGVAQLGEHLPCKQGVMGSNPIISTKDDTNHVHREILTVCSSGG